MSIKSGITLKSNIILFILITIIALVVIVNSIAIFNMFMSDAKITILLFGSVGVIYWIALTTKRKIENQKVKAFKESKEFNDILNDYSFKYNDDLRIFESLHNGFQLFIHSENQRHAYFDLENILFIGVLCNCQNLSKEEIYKIEDEEVSVSMYSIGRVHSKWGNRFSAEKLRKSIELIYYVINSFDLQKVSLQKIEEMNKLLKNNKKWSFF